MALSTAKLGQGGVNNLFRLYYGRDATQDELNYWSNKSDAELRPKLIPNSSVQLAKNKPAAAAAPVVPTQTATPTQGTAPVAIPNPSVIKDYNVTGVSPDGKTLMGIPKTPAKPVVETQADVDKKYADAAAKNPAIATLAKGGSTLEEIINGLSTGNISGLLDWEGKPFSAEDQQAALDQGMKDNQAFYAAQQAKDKADTEASLAQKQADYQDYLINSGQQFQTDKTTADQSAADSGILFSGGRAQKERNLARTYEQDQASKLATASRNIGTAANALQYKYGGDAANSLGKYYNLGSNTYNPSTATGGVSSNALSSVYNPSNYNFQGTVNNEQKVNANTRAAGYLFNKGNKLLATGYNNKI